MSFASTMYAGEQVFDDSTHEHDDELMAGFARGYQGMFSSSQSADEISVPFPKELLIPESEWPDWIKEQEQNKTRISDLVNQAGLPCKDQAKTNYCWGNAPTHLAEIQLLIQNQPMTILSPASVCARQNGFRNQGGMGEDALRQIIDKGINTVKDWPANAIDEKYDTAATRQSALRYRATEWYRLKPRNKQEQISCLLRRIPLAVGLNYWRHEPNDYEAVWLNGQIGVRGRNSWGMSYPQPGGMGYFIRQGSKMLADDAVAIRQMIAVG